MTPVNTSLPAALVSVHIDAGSTRCITCCRLPNAAMNLLVWCRWHMLCSGGWEWTDTKFTGLPGFQPMQDYLEYSADFFDGRHFVLKGASPATHASLVRDSFRNFYQGQYPYMFAKFRCCKPANEE